MSFNACVVQVQCDWIHFKRCNTAARKKRLAMRSEKDVPGRIKNAVQSTRAETETGPYFDIVHFAGTVTYDACQFLPKNRDPLSADVLALFKVSDNEFLQGLFLQKMSRTGTYGAGAARSHRRKKDSAKLSVSAHFKNSLLDLMDKMLAAQPHFIRCIKPNRSKQPQRFLAKEVCRAFSLRCSAVRATYVGSVSAQQRCPCQSCVILVGSGVRCGYRCVLAHVWTTIATECMLLVHRG